MIEPKYVRIDNEIFTLPDRVPYHAFASISEAKRWSREQRPGDVKVEQPVKKLLVTTQSAKTYAEFLMAEARETGRRNHAKPVRF